MENFAMQMIIFISLTQNRSKQRRKASPEQYQLQQIVKTKNLT